MTPRYSPVDGAARPVRVTIEKLDLSARSARQSITEAIGILEALTRVCELLAAANQNGDRP
ncbi:MAG: hypothetical protein RL385_1091 [Pseudomonadota bacterium]